MIYEVINPSDPITLEADDLEVARVTCLLLGQGAYALQDEVGTEVMPLFIVGGYDDWCEEHSFNLTALMGDRKAEVVECLRTVMCCEVAERAAICAAVGGDGEAMARHNDDRRSSMNDICGLATKLADKAVTELAEPR